MARVKRITAEATKTACHLRWKFHQKLAFLDLTWVGPRCPFPQNRLKIVGKGILEVRHLWEHLICNTSYACIYALRIYVASIINCACPAHLFPYSCKSIFAHMLGIPPAKGLPLFCHCMLRLPMHGFCILLCLVSMSTGASQLLGQARASPWFKPVTMPKEIGACQALRFCLGGPRLSSELAGWALDNMYNSAECSP